MTDKKDRMCTAKEIPHEWQYEDRHTVFDSIDIIGSYVYPQILSRGLESRSEKN